MTCTATSNRTGERCKRSPIKGGTVCSTHGGRAPQVALAAARRTVMAEAQSIVAKYDGSFPELEDAAGALMQVASEYLVLKDVLRDRANELTEIAHTTKQGEQQVAACLTAYLSALDHIADILVKINKIPALTDRSQVAEQDYRTLVAAVRQGVFSSPHLDHEQKRDLMQTIGNLVQAAYGE